MLIVLDFSVSAFLSCSYLDSWNFQNFPHRKVRARSNQRYNQQLPDENLKLNCKYVSIWMCVIMTCAWLFLLSYMLAVVHSEYHKLTKDYEKCKWKTWCILFLLFRFVEYRKGHCHWVTLISFKISLLNVVYASPFMASTLPLNPAS